MSYGMSLGAAEGFQRPVPSALSLRLNKIKKVINILPIFA